MGWNDPGNGDKKGNGNDPWGKENGPPDLDEALRQLQRKVAMMFGGGKGSGFNVQGGKNNFFGFFFIGAIILIIYILSGIYIVQPYEEAVVKRFGQYNRTEQSGPHWIPLLIESRTILNVEEVKNFEIEDLMLTKDENIMEAAIAVQYRIDNSENYLFNLTDPDQTIKQVAESALRSVVGQSTLNEVLTSGRSDVVRRVREQVERNLNEYQAGLLVADLALLRTRAPQQVKDAFDDAIKAQQDEERYKNEAHAYANQIIPIAEGKAKRVLEEAEAYKQQQILKANGSTARFDQLYPEYKRQPEILRDRLYLDTLEEVYSKTNKVIVDVDSGNNLMVLPLDQIMRGQTALNDNKLETKDLRLSSTETSPSTFSSNSSRPEQRPSYSDANRYSRG